MPQLLPGDRLRLADLGSEPQPSCEWCGDPLSAQRSDARFCSAAHRAAAHRARTAQEASSYEEFRPRVRAGATSVDRYSDVWWKYVLSAAVDPDNVLGREEFRALSKGSNSAGRYLVPTDFAKKILEAAVAESVIAQLATQLNTDSGSTLNLPLITAYGAAAWIAEAATLGSSDETFANGALGAHKSGAKTIASEELVQDGGIAFDDLLAGASAAGLAPSSATASPRAPASASPWAS